MSEQQVDLSRRNFLKTSASVAAGLAILGMSTPSFAKEVALKKTTLSQIPTDPVAVAQSSELVQNAWNYLLDQINTIHNSELKAQVLGLYQNTVPTFMKLYQDPSQVQALYDNLLKVALVDPKLTPIDKFFPPLKDLNTAPQPFFSASGSGYASHHAYPGGLVTHTAVNVEITKGILAAYKGIMNYEEQYDIAMAGELLHDLAKPWVFQWQQDGSSLPEYQIAGTGAHHIFSIAEAIYRGLPAAEVVAQACAHNHPGSPNDEAQVVNWLKAAAYIAAKDPIELGLLDKDGQHLHTPHQHAGYIVHLGDHDWVLSVPVAQQSVAYLKQAAVQGYGLKEDDLKGLEFNKFRNYIAAQYSFMHLHSNLANSADPLAEAIKLSQAVVAKA